MPRPDDGRRYRGAIIGGGGVARQSHLPAFRCGPNVRERVEIVAVVDGAADLAPVDGVPHLTHRDQLRDLGPIDFIDICTPTATHLELIEWGLAQGYHVLCEKPVVSTRAEAERLVAQARRHQRVLMPCHQYRYNPAWRTVMEWLGMGAIGRWHLAEFSVYRQLADPGAGGTAVPWRGRRADSQGGVWLDHGTHLAYQLLDVGGVPAAVTGWTGRLRHHDYDVEDTAVLLFEYPDRLATMSLTWAAQRRENRIRFIGERGAIEWEGGELRLLRGGGCERRDVSADLEKTAYWRWFACLFEAFLVTLDGAPAEPHLEDIRGVATVLEAAYAASAAGHKVPVPA